MLYFLKNKIFLNLHPSLALRDRLCCWALEAGGLVHVTAPPPLRRAHAPARWSPSTPGYRGLGESVPLCARTQPQTGPLVEGSLAGEAPPSALI